MFRPVRIFICLLILTVSCAEHPFDFVENAFYNETPWARNFNVTGKIQNLDMNKNMTDSIDEQRRMLSSIIEIYKRCSLQYRSIHNFERLCFIFTATPLEYIEPLLFANDDAVNLQNSFLTFGLSFFYHNTYSKWKAAKLGFTGFHVGHEIAHSFVEVHRTPRELGYFSKESQKCVQDQYQKSCDFFREGNESSMDLDDLRDHSANNVRVNVAAQYPGFQKPFHCSDDSRMMQSATDQCIIYGKDAPETHKKFIQSK
ncbi:Protein CBG10911 [Caenorhabditis briggsae]|uniref:Protein CBG10911 n=1 Tax=Caenorhabditis briggsae TaxID=6238 RepID=A8XC91_CAEBR|nr:Protein CBG10911 [Caenorhabditis briggsae]CAP30189.2 Protein CBG10911 [Caenorhabditis briggsae]